MAYIETLINTLYGDRYDFSTTTSDTVFRATGWEKSGTRFQAVPLEGLLGNVYVCFGVLDIVGWMVWNWSYQLPVHKGDAGSTTVGV